MKKITARIFFNVLLVSLALAVAAAGRAQVANLDEIQKAAVGLTALPPRLGDDGSLTGEPGSTIQTQVRVRNVTTQPVTVKTLAEDFIIGEDGRTPVVVDMQIDSRFSLASWLELPVTDTFIPPGAIQSLPVIIRVPKDARPGGRYAMIMHQPTVVASKTAAPEQGGEAAIKSRVGSLLYFRVPGPVHEEAIIRNISVPGFSEFGPVPIAFDIENLSDVHIRPLIEIEIRGFFGRQAALFPVETQNVFPYSLRRFETSWAKIWGFGRYTAHFNVSYGESGQVTTASVSFWLLPYRLIAAVIVVLLVLMTVGNLIRRHVRHRNAVEHQQVELLEDRIRQLENELHEKETH